MPAVHEITQPPTRLRHWAAAGANLISSQLLASHAGDGLRFLNRGISGNRIVDLYSRWKVDALNLQPDLISILIGVNDTWHGFMYDNGVEVDRFATIYRLLLSGRASACPVCSLCCANHLCCTVAWLRKGG